MNGKSELIVNSEDFQNMTSDNKFIGTAPIMKNSKIEFFGTGNILIVEDGVNIVNSSIRFEGNNSVVYLSQSRFNYILDLVVNHNSVFFMGKNNYINSKLSIILSEEKHCFIGNDGLFSLGIWMRTADPHLVYSCETKERKNLSKSIFIGDHVWIGQSAMILKGTQVESGSIIGAMSVVPGKRIAHNESWAGNPCKKIAEAVFWHGACVHKWVSENTKNSMDFNKYSNGKPNTYIYSYKEGEYINFYELDKKFSTLEMSEKIELLKLLAEDKRKNRFVSKKQIKTSVRIKNKIKRIISKIFKK